MPGLTRSGENQRRRRLLPRDEYLPVYFDAHVNSYRDFHQLCGHLGLGEGFERMVAVIQRLDRAGELEALLEEVEIEKLKGVSA